MPHEIDYYASLRSAIARLEVNSYEARGAIYDCSRQQLLELLNEAQPPCSAEDIAREESALLDAIRLIEFGGEGDGAEVDRPLLQSPAETGFRSPPVPAKEARLVAGTKKRNSIHGKLVGVTLIAAAVIGAGVAGYVYLTDGFAMPWPGTSTNSPQRAPA